MVDTGIDKTKEEFVKIFSESFRRMSDGWSAGFRHWREVLGSDAPGWTNPLATAKILNSTALALKFQDMINGAFHDLTSIMPCGRDADKIRELRERWRPPYEKLIREMFVLPAPTEIDLLSRQWRSVLDLFPAGKWMFPDMRGMFPASNWFCAPDSRNFTDLTMFWKEVYEQNFARLFPFPGNIPASGYRKLLEKAVHAQLLFLRTVSDVQDGIVGAADKALEMIMAAVTKWDTIEESSETYLVFCKTWLASTEAAYSELFVSREFFETVAESIRMGLDAQSTMAFAISEALSLWSVKRQEDSPQLSKSVEDIEEQLQNLKKELELLKSKGERSDSSEQRPDDSKPTGEA